MRVRADRPTVQLGPRRSRLHPWDGVWLGVAALIGLLLVYLVVLIVLNLPTP